MQLSRPKGVRSSLVLAAVALALARPAAVDAFLWPWDRGDPWPSSSDQEVLVLDHPLVESRFAAGAAGGAPYRFAAYGDQRALADGEWQKLIRRILYVGRTEGAFDFVVDTGDIVDDGHHSDQFRYLRRRILFPIRHLPYLVAVGNHEVADNDGPTGRENAAHFLAYLDPTISPERMYYRKEIGPATFLFLDTNDMVYGDEGLGERCPDRFHESCRAYTQVEWLVEQLETTAQRPLTIVGMHHPLVHSSDKHRESSISLWNLRLRDGRLLVDALADGGVDLILTGHTHTYERFVLRREDGAEIQVVNVSGRPRDSVLWIGSEDRRATDLRAGATEWLREKGWPDLDRWEIRQEDVMLKDDEANQFAVFDVGPDGGLSMQVHFLDPESSYGTRRGEKVRLH